ncbi:MAG: penicillin acylase family protein [Acidimicrobiales bacterium]
MLPRAGVEIPQGERFRVVSLYVTDDQDPTDPEQDQPGSEPGRISRRRLLQAGVVATGAAAAAPFPSVGRRLPGSAGRSPAGRTDLGGAAPKPAPALDSPPPQQLRAVSIAPPGQSGFFSITGQVEGDAARQPGAYGAHVDDQRLLYWTFGYKPGGFAAPTGTPEQPSKGSRLYRDEYGVPIIYGDSAFDVWFAAGWAFAQDRLFEMDAIRRLATGRLSELVGPSGVPGDVQARVLGYTDGEYEAMYADLLDPEDRVAGDACVAGINAWIERVLADPLQLMPAEYALLSSLPEPWDRRDLLATGVLIIRSVATAGGNEMGNVANLMTLQHAYPTAEARGIFQDLFWLEDAKAVTTVPASSGAFPNSSLNAGERQAVFESAADYSQTLPAGLANGPGTGAFPAPGELPSLPSLPGSGSMPSLPSLPGPESMAALNARLPAAVRAGLARATASLAAWGRSLHGGSYQFAIAPSRSATGRALLVSGPELGYSYPSELYELEVHGGGYHARGTTVPGLPVVGIGYGTRLAWALTTGESKTIDSFIETTRPNPMGGPPQYLFEGSWRDQECRTETIRYRPAANGVPVGPPVESVTVPVCRTHHGPVVATADAPAGTSRGTGVARSTAYAIWGKEVLTLSGLLQWNRATTFDEFAAGVAKVTWNENAMYADADGTIAYWHPGLYPVRSPRTDLRFPTPGTGGYEWQGMLPFEQMPHVVNPAEGYLANWNTKPAAGWLEDAGVAPGQPSGAFQRVQEITSQIAGRHDLGFDDLATIDRFIGIADKRARSLLPLLLRLRSSRDLSAAERSALSLLGAWDYSAYEPPPGVVMGAAAGTTDGPAPTIFAAVVEALHAELFGSLPSTVVSSDDQQDSLHRFDIKPLDNLAMRILEPSTSALEPSRDYLGGRNVSDVLRISLNGALDSLTVEFGTVNQSAWRRLHPTSSVCSLTGGVIGPCLTMPFEDRGSYIHHVAFL